MNRNIFCSRKGGATIDGNFYPLQRTSEILAMKIERASAKQEAKEKKRRK